MNRRIKAFILLWISLALLPACAWLSEAVPVPSPQSPNPAPTADAGQRARKHLEVLTATIGPRTPGSPEEAEAAGYIKTVFEALGYEVRTQRFSFDTDDEPLNSMNVIAVRPGLSAQEIIIGAHYDSTDDGDGADDNASGVAVMLEVAARLANVRTPYTLRFIAFGAEENDLDGSSYYVAHMSQSAIQNTVGMINLDSLIAGDVAFIYGDAGPGTLRDWILSHAESLGLALEGRTAAFLDAPDGTPCDCADYDAFQEVGIPFAYFEAARVVPGDKDGLTQVSPRFGDAGMIRHTEYDTVNYLDTNFPGRIDARLSLFVTLLHDTLGQFSQIK